MLGRRARRLPAQYARFEPVLIATIVVFIVDLVGNSIGFGNRFRRRVQVLLPKRRSRSAKQECWLSAVAVRPSFQVEWASSGDR
jgi:hypothetical protein